MYILTVSIKLTTGHNPEILEEQIEALENEDSEEKFILFRKFLNDLIDKGTLMNAQTFNSSKITGNCVTEIFLTDLNDAKSLEKKYTDLYKEIANSKKLQIFTKIEESLDNNFDFTDSKKFKNLI